MIQINLSTSSDSEDDDSGERFTLYENENENKNGRPHESNSGNIDCHDNDDNEEEEPPHPLGFSSSLGRTRFSVDAEEENESIERYKRRWGYLNPFDRSNSINSNALLTSPIQQFPPLHAYLDAETAPTCALLQYEFKKHQHEQEDPIDKITMLLQASSIVDETTILSPIRQIQAIQQQIHSPQHYNSQQQRDSKIQQRVERYRVRFEHEHQEAAQALASLLQRQEAKAQQEHKQRQDQYEKQQQANQQQQQENEKQRLQVKEEENQAKLQLKQKEDERVAKEKAMEQEALRKEEERNKEPEYIGRAKKLVADLVQLRASVEPFETSQAVSKRRLGIKKIANGKVNTLTEDPAKVRSVANEVSQAIAAVRADDAEVKQRLQARDLSVSEEMTRGKRYFLDFLSSKAIVRAQADGFNGQRGDGFPLANMLALVSLENKDLNPILAAHIYTVCPVAIPAIPTMSKVASEDDFMESLGMIKDKNGEFETFEKFLSRTEGIISLMADIMAAQPATHTLLGGNEGAVKWLSRFLKLLPETPVSPLPLFTAPVLDAFLTGAGHMLANVHGDRFKQYLDLIVNDIMERLDTGPIGKPSSIRLKKTIDGGFDEFKSELPSRAMAELYLGSESGSIVAWHSPPKQSVSQKLMSQFSGYTIPQNQSSSTSSPFGQASGQSSQRVNPFGAPSNTNNKSSFGAFGSKTNSSNQSPFGAPSNNQTTQSPFSSSAGTTFGAPSNSIQNQSPFGAGANNTNNQSSFGGATNTNNNQSPFGTSTNSNFSSPFDGSGGSNQLPFGAVTSTFGINSRQHESGIMEDDTAHGFQAAGVFGNVAPTPTLFGAAPSPVFGSSTNASPFVQPNNSSSPFGTTFGGGSPFGTKSSTGPTSNSTQFGQTTPFGAPASMPFGSSTQSGGMQGPGMSSSTPFGSSISSNASPFGAPSQSVSSFNNPSHHKNNNGNRPICKYFAQGRCRFGDSCRFSHDTNSGGGEFGSNNNSFGGNRNAFGANNNALGANTPFGGPRR